ncbi:MAG TPA: mycofactocin-coupled SDR family oxidoreductase [Sporichthya sp.]|nr:mycofactocin-coupled SDR family oxidoreductase [Sporichthya sp.]
MGRLDNKVAFITGAARGQGRAHAIRMAEEGADIIGVDICEQIGSVPYPLGTMAELEETAAAVEKLDRRMVIAKADVRSLEQLQAAVDQGVAELGRLDIVSCNAGIWSAGMFTDLPEETYRDMIDVQMHGPYYACKATVPKLIEQGRGGSIIITSSVAGLKGFPNQVHYNMAKHAVVGLMRTLANELAPHMIRVNSVHPSSTLTPMIDNEAIHAAFAPGVQNAKLEDFGDTFTAMNLLPIPWMQAVDISNAVLFLASDEARYITGVTLPVDAGFMAKL